MRLAAAITALVVLAFPATALAGGWASVEVAAPPAGIGPGDTWQATFVVKQHGLTPLDDASPSLLIDNGRGETQQFFAEHAGRPGTYVADVVFPSEGRWNARVFDGWTDATPHRMAPIEVPTVGATAPATAREPVRLPAVPQVEAAPAGFPVAKVAAIAFVGVVWLGLWVAVSGASVRLPVAMRARRAAWGSGARPAFGSAAYRSVLRIVLNGELRWVGRVRVSAGVQEVANSDAFGGGWPVMHRGGRISGHARISWSPLATFCTLRRCTT